MKDTGLIPSLSENWNAFEPAPKKYTQFRRWMYAIDNIYIYICLFPPVQVLFIFFSIFICGKESLRSSRWRSRSKSRRWRWDCVKVVVPEIPYCTVHDHAVLLVIEHWNIHSCRHYQLSRCPGFCTFSDGWDPAKLYTREEVVEVFQFCLIYVWLERKRTRVWSETCNITYVQFSFHL